MNAQDVVTEKAGVKIKAETIEFLSRMLLGGGAENPSATNGCNEKLTEAMTASNAGFFDKARYPECSLK